MQRYTRLLALTLGLSAILAACSGGGASPSAATSVAPSVAPSVAASEAPSAAPSAAADTIALAENVLGSIIVDGEGMTLYGFTPDTDGVPTCYDDCATAWPPLTVDDAAAAVAGAGLDQSLISVVDRTDGTKQVVYGDWPLYYFANDAGAGDTNGQGLNERWFVVDATGALIGA